VLLVNGDQFVSEPAPAGGRVLALVASLTGGPVLRVRAGGANEAIPVDALPYLGHGLDPALFDLGALQRAERGGRLPVRVGFAGRVRALPGIRYARTGPGWADGYLTASSARVFGAALARQFRDDHARGSYSGGGLLAGADITLAGDPAGSAAPERPRFPMHTLTVTGTNLNGKPDSGDMVIVISVAHPDAFGGNIFLFGSEAFNTFYRGTAKYSVPAGQYWAMGFFFGSRDSTRLVILPQFAVRTGPKTVHLAERSATSKLRLTTPRPTQSPVATFVIFRGGPSGQPTSVAFVGAGPLTWVNPVSTPPTFGSLRWYTAAQLLSPAKAAGPPYAYNLNYPAPPGTIPSLAHRVTPASLATVSERYYQGAPSTGGWFTEGGTAAETAATGGGFFYPLPMPGLQTQYMSANPQTIWESNYFQFASCFCGGQFDAFQLLRPGQRLTENWGEYPLSPQPDVSLLRGRNAADFPVAPSAFRAGNTLSLDLTAFSDNQFGHIGPGLVGGIGHVTGTYEIRQNGVTLARGNAVNGIAPVRLSPKRSTISLTLAAAWRSLSWPLSTASTTTWTWPSVRRPRAVVPDGWYCRQTRTGRLVRSCAVQPLVTLRYQVRGLALDGAAPPGRQVIGMTAGHLQLASAAPIAGVTAEVSFNSGKSWHPATVTAVTPGQYRLAFTAPAGAEVTLRVSAADRDGDSMTETIVRGYRVGS
jgi:hypothetical protein